VGSGSEIVAALRLLRYREVLGNAALLVVFRRVVPLVDSSAALSGPAGGRSVIRKGPAATACRTCSVPLANRVLTPIAPLRRTTLTLP